MISRARLLIGCWELTQFGGDWSELSASNFLMSYGTARKITNYGDPILACKDPGTMTPIDVIGIKNEYINNYVTS
jgi:hypothetical protein